VAVAPADGQDVPPTAPKQRKRRAPSPPNDDDANDA
jgi:hypothetical protein